MIRTEQKLLRGVLAGLIAASALTALASHAWFLRRFAGDWPESFCSSDVAAIHQGLILTQFAIAFAAVAIAHLRRRVLAVGVPLTFFAIAQGALQTWFNYRMSQWQWDVGCGVSYDWSPKRAFFQLFMTRYAGLAVVIAFAIVVIAGIWAALRDEAA
jgi:hypothetical protein